MSDRSDDDQRLLKRCAKGDEDALRALVGKYQSLVFNYSRRILGHREDAEEVAIEAFTRLWRSAGSFRDECSVRSHLVRIAVNLCRDRLRRQPLPAPPPETPSASAESIFCAMAHLSPEDREVVTLYYLEGLDYSELGAALNISYDVLKTRLVRARARLRMLVGVNDEA